MKFFGIDSFLIEGSSINSSLKDSPYDRLPLASKNLVRKEIWDLSKNSAGISIKFITNSSSITVKWLLLNDFAMHHMPDSGIKGIDLYCKSSKRWQYVGTGIPKGKSNEQTIIKNLSIKKREFKLYLPLYDGIKKLEIGIQNHSYIEKPPKPTKKPIVFYGTSITQGGCASRPGIAHTNIISRETDIDCINYGFSGNGRMEKAISSILAEIDALFYVIDCLANMTTIQVEKNMMPLVKIIRKKNPLAPIVFIENIIFESGHFNKKIKNEIEEKNNESKIQFDKMIKKNIKNIFHISQKGAIGKDNEGTVDGVHFNDLGFMRYSNFLITNFKKIKIL